jgi:hypothetical protein
MKVSWNRNGFTVPNPIGLVNGQITGFYLGLLCRFHYQYRPICHSHYAMNTYKWESFVRYVAIEDLFRP